MKKALQSPQRLLFTLATATILMVGLSATSRAQLIPIQNISTTGVLGGSGSASVGIANLTDNNFTSNSYQEWLGVGSATLDLGSVQTVDRLVVAMRPVGGLPILSQGYVEVSLDGVIWTHVKNFDNHGAVSSGNILALGFHAQEARYLRFTMDTPGLNVQVGELRVYNGEGPRVSLLSRGPDTAWSPTNATANPPRTPFNLVDQNPNTFALYDGHVPGELLLRLDSVEYDQGWDAIKIGIRGFPAGGGGPNNPGIIEVFAGDGTGAWTSIYNKAQDPVTSISDIILQMDTVQTDRFIRINYSRGDVAAINIQFREIDVLPIPEPTSIALGGIGLAMIAFLRHRRKRA